MIAFPSILFNIICQLTSNNTYANTTSSCVHWSYMKPLISLQVVNFD